MWLPVYNLTGRWRWAGGGLPGEKCRTGSTNRRRPYQSPTQLFDAVYNTVHTTIRKTELAFERGFYLIWERIVHTLDGPTQINETSHKCSGCKGQTPPRGGLSRGGFGEDSRSRWEGSPSDTMTLIGVCRDAFRLIHTEPGAQPEELKPALDEVEIL